MNNSRITRGLFQARPLISDDCVPEHAYWSGPGRWVLLDAFHSEVLAVGSVDRDFLAALLELFGAARDRALIWELFGCHVTWRNRAGVECDEEGWRRWYLGSADGQVRPSDRTAPAIILGPGNKALFRASPRHRIRPVSSLGELVELAANLCQGSREVAV